MTSSFPPPISTSISTSIGSASPHSVERAAVGAESGSRVRAGSGVMWLADSELNKLNSWEEGRQREGQGQGGVSGLYVDTARRTSSAAVTLLPDGAATAATACKSGSASGAAASVSAQSGAGTALTDWDTQTTPCRRGARSAHGSFCQEQEQEEEDVDDEEDDEEDDSDDEEVEHEDEDEDRIDSRDEEDEEEEDGYESGFSEGTHLRKLDAERGGLGMGGGEGLSPMEVYEAVTAKVRVCSLEQCNVDMCDAT
jgi:hypothetical protein